MEILELTQEIGRYLSSKKAEDILLIDVREKTTLCDYFVIASGRNTTQVRALCENLEEHLSKQGLEPRRTEGVREGRWGVLDYGDVVVPHLQRRIPPLLSPRAALDGRGNTRRVD